MCPLVHGLGDRVNVAAALCLFCCFLLFCLVFLSLLFLCFTSLLKHVILFFSLLFYFLALANEKVEDINGCPRSQSQMVRIIFILKYNAHLHFRLNYLYKWTRNFFGMPSCLRNHLITFYHMYFFECNLWTSDSISTVEYV